jgi:hypothetical protein
MEWGILKHPLSVAKNFDKGEITDFEVTQLGELFATII